MLDLTMPQEYHRMTSDLVALTYTDNFFMVYVGDKYVQTCPTLAKAEAFTVQEGVAIYEVRKEIQESRRVF